MRASRWQDLKHLLLTSPLDLQRFLEGCLTSVPFCHSVNELGLLDVSYGREAFSFGSLPSIQHGNSNVLMTKLADHFRNPTGRLTDDALKHDCRRSMKVFIPPEHLQGNDRPALRIYPGFSNLL